MNIFKKFLNNLGFNRKKQYNPKDKKQNIEDQFPFIKSAAKLNKRMLVEEERRKAIWSNQALYEDIAVLINKHFDDQNEELKKRVERLEKELKSQKDENKGLLVENKILKSEEAVV